MSGANSATSEQPARERRRGEMIATLQKLAAAEGPQVTHRQFAGQIGRSTSYVATYFDSWSDLREAAGLPQRQRGVHTRESLIDALLQAERVYGQPVSRLRFRRLTGISACSADRLFGSWREFRQAAGLTEMASAGIPQKYTRDELLRMMKEQIPLLGSTMTRHQFAKAAGVSTATIDRLGNWSVLRRELGLSLRGCGTANAFMQALGVELVDEPALLMDFSDSSLLQPGLD